MILTSINYEFITAAIFACFLLSVIFSEFYESHSCYQNVGFILKPIHALCTEKNNLYYRPDNLLLYQDNHAIFILFSLAKSCSSFLLVSISPSTLMFALFFSFITFASFAGLSIPCSDLNLVYMMFRAVENSIKPQPNNRDVMSFNEYPDIRI